MEVLLLPVAAVVAGAVSFSSPCCLPLIPGYLSYVSALPVSELGRRATRRVTLRAALAFVAGFTVVFTLLGVSVTLLGPVLLRHVPFIVRLAGVVVIVMGLAMLGALRLPLLDRERRLDLARIPAGPPTAFPLGMAFAVGWVPCIGPVLATILATAAATETVALGGVLLALYSIGLGLPFIALALGFQRARGSLDWLRRNGRLIERFGGVLLVAVGVLFVTGTWRRFFLPLQRWFAELGWPPI
ncbi:MAG: cytochrome c biogenesis CcdA family protein [Acidimicrobiales bacterium]